MKKKLYISVAVSGRDIDEAKQLAESAKAHWCDKYDVITPFEIHQHEEEEKLYAYYMGKDIEVLLGCDAIFMCPGWIYSKGCNAEYQIAKIYGLEIIG